MLRTSLSALGIVIAMSAAAQQGGNVSIKPAKPAAATVSYTQVGSSMPALVITPYHDTSAGRDTTTYQRQLTKKQRKRQNARMAKKVMTADDFSGKGNLFVMMFNPNCSHCEEETMILEKNISLFKNSELVLLANTRMKEYVPAFVQRYHTDDYPAFHLGTDSSGFIDKTFLYQALPQINIYNTSHKLIKVYTGDVSIDSLKQYIQ